MNTKTVEAPIKELFAGAVALDKIEVGENMRRHFDQEQMKELTENVQHSGVLVPIILVPNGKPGTYRLVAGERRVRAAKAAGLKEIPARVVEADEKTQAEIQMFENLHRADLGPIEEAQAFKKLLDAGKHTIEGLAKQMDKSVKYVTRSIRLMELPKAATRAIEKAVLTPEHGHQILRAPEDKREKLVEFALAPKWGGVLPTIHELKREIETKLEKDLSQACFPKDRDFAGASACNLCPFNTGNQDALFEGAKDGKCTNAVCFTKKTNHFLREFKEQAEKRFPKLKCVGIGTEDYNHNVKGAAILSAEEAKSEKVKALIEKVPEKFGFAVVKPSRFGKSAPMTVVVCKDAGLLETQIRKSTVKTEHPMTREEQEREQFLRNAEGRALFAEAAKKVREVKKEQIIGIVLALNGADLAYAAIGIPETDNLEKALHKLSERDLLRLAWLCSVDSWRLDEAFKSVGVCVQNVRKEARAEALTEWQKAQKAQAEAEKKEVAATAK